MATNDNGISKDSVPTGRTLVAIIVFISLALYNVVELGFIIFATFKRRSGLYFWSFIVAAGGIAPYAVGFLLKALQVMDTTWVYVTMIVVGWCAMVSGQSVVLYSRLHLVMHSGRRLRLIRAMIIVDGIICHVPITVMVYGANSAHPQPFIVPYSIYEKIQVTIFFIQEVIISGCYIYETTRMLRIIRAARHRSGTPSLMAHLIVVNVFIVLVDITILALEYAGLYDLQTAYKALVYSVKLKLEFRILNRLVELATRSANRVSSLDTRPRAVDGGNVWMDALDNGRGKKADQGLGNKIQVLSKISIQTSQKRSECECDGSCADGSRSGIARAVSSSSRQGFIEDRFYLDP